MRCGPGFTVLQLSGTVRPRPAARVAVEDCQGNRIFGGTDPVKKVVQVISMLLAAAGIVLATLFLPVAAGTGPEGLRAARLGRPFWFVLQDQSRCSPPGDMWATRFLSPWECPFAVVWWRLAAVAGGLALLLAAAAFLTQRVHCY